MLHKLIVSDRNNLILLEEDQIIRVEGEGSYCTVYSQSRPPITISRNLAFLERQLKSDHFFRVHQSHLVHLHKIFQIECREGCVVQLSDHSRVPVARRRKEELLERLRS